MDRPLSRFLNRLLLRSALSQEAQNSLLALDPPRTEKKARWDLVRSGQITSFACLVASGTIGRSEQFSDGSRRTAALYIEGDMCDLHSVAVPVARWNITALTDCAIYEVPHTDLRRLHDQYPDLAMAFWRDTVVDASILAKWVTVLSGLSTKSRVAHILCEYGTRAQAAGLEKEGASFPLTQSQLAELAGTTPVHISRTLKALADAGAIGISRGCSRILDFEKLCRIGEFDPTYLMLGPPA
ncbi:Crp/Fnr family transcriptional regulator [Sphingomonas sabuli]|uniref:Crp/Fnr family transcriptional regulator n=1 Tax=Sphingomonas sabuli TaxID=2764186 RepID=A0A7G9L1W1_9SPHN|nr:Crp/Fnr family transcriptional regulator [Sphingomonas sabuli]QNM82610.1 Crp/Fnr family transcriptional regulator [Sphingomonas sabuli]